MTTIRKQSHDAAFVRALRIRQLIRARPNCENARTIARALDVSEKCVRRTLTILRVTYGVRIVYDRQRHGLSAPKIDASAEQYLDACARRKN